METIRAVMLLSVETAELLTSELWLAAEKEQIWS
jgi:hypothetical protein